MALNAKIPSGRRLDQLYPNTGNDSISEMRFDDRFTFKEVSMDKQTEGTIISVRKQWWLSIRTKALRTGPLDGTVFPHIAKVRYTVDGKEYIRRIWIHAGLPVPKVGSTVQVLYNSDRPSKAKVM